MSNLSDNRDDCGNICGELNSENSYDQCGVSKSLKYCWLKKCALNTNIIDNFLTCFEKCLTKCHTFNFNSATW